MPKRYLWWLLIISTIFICSGCLGWRTKDLQVKFIDATITLEEEQSQGHFIFSPGTYQAKASWENELYIAYSSTARVWKGGYYYLLLKTCIADALHFTLTAPFIAPAGIFLSDNEDIEVNLVHPEKKELAKIPIKFHFGKYNRIIKTNPDGTLPISTNLKNHLTNTPNFSIEILKGKYLGLYQGKFISK